METFVAYAPFSLSRLEGNMMIRWQKSHGFFVKDVYRRKHSSLRSFFLSDFVFLYLRKLDYYVAKGHCFSFWYSSEMYIEENIRRLRSFFLSLLKETWWLCGKRVIAFLVVFVKDVYSGKHSSLVLLFSLSRLERNLTIRWQKSHGFLSKMYIEENIRRFAPFFSPTSCFFI